MKDVLTEALDIERTPARVTTWARAASAASVDTPVAFAVPTKSSTPIPYAYLDDAPLEERRARRRRMRRVSAKRLV